MPLFSRSSWFFQVTVRSGYGICGTKLYTCRTLGIVCSNVSIVASVYYAHSAHLCTHPDEVSVYSSHTCTQWLTRSADWELYGIQMIIHWTGILRFIYLSDTVYFLPYTLLWVCQLNKVVWSLHYSECLEMFHRLTILHPNLYFRVKFSCI